MPGNKIDLEIGQGFGGVFVLSRCFLDFSVGVGALDIGVVSDVFIFVLYYFMCRYTCT